METKDYRIKNSLIDLSSSNVIKGLQRIEERLAKVLIADDELIKHACKPDSTEERRSQFNEEVITAILANIIAGSPIMNEQLQSIADAIETKLQVKVSIELRNEDGEEWKIESTNLYKE